MAWQHDALLIDLAGHLRGNDRMVWTDMQLGPSGSPRPDVFTLQKSYSKPMPTAYEVKVSRSDLRSDTTSGKWQSYLKYAGSVTFAVPDGLCTLADIPDGCGLIVRKAEVWRYARRPTVQKVTLPMDACMKLLIDGVGRCYEGRAIRSRTADLWRGNDAVLKKFGKAVAECARDLVAARKRAEDARDVANYEWERMRKEVEATKALLISQAKKEHETWAGIRQDVLDWLSLDEGASAWAVQQRIRALKTACDADPRVERAEGDLSRARHALQNALASLTPKDVAA